jgi:hypothetical protein
MYRPSEPVGFFDEDFIEKDDMGVVDAIMALFKNDGELNKLPPSVPGVRHPDMDVGVPNEVPANGELIVWNGSLGAPRGVPVPPKPLSAISFRAEASFTGSQSISRGIFQLVPSMPPKPSLSRLSKPQNIFPPRSPCAR